MSGRATVGGSAAEEREKGRPEPIGGLVGAILERLGIAERVQRAKAAAQWEDLVGPHIARVTRNPVVRGRTLFVEVDSAAWLAELNMKRHELMARINAGRARGRVEKIVFLQSDGREDSRTRRGGGRGGG